MERLNENLRAADVELTQDDLRDINVALAQIDVHGLRGTGQHHRHPGAMPVRRAPGE
jgi:hypothetical protein